MKRQPQSEKLADLIALAGRTMHQIQRLRSKLGEAGIGHECESTDVAYCQISGIRHHLAMAQIAAKQQEHEMWKAECETRDARRPVVLPITRNDDAAYSPRYAL